MVQPAPGVVVVVRFPFWDLSSTKLRPAVALASAGRGDWLLCQVTSRSHSDPQAVPVQADSLIDGSLRLDSYVRPRRLFTASEDIIAGTTGKLPIDIHRSIVDVLVKTLTEPLDD